MPDGTPLSLRGERDDSWLVKYVGSEYLVKKHNTTATMVRATAQNRDGHTSVFLHSQSQGPSVEVPNGTAVVVKGQAGDSIIVSHEGVERLVKRHNVVVVVGAVSSAPRGLANRLGDEAGKELAKALRSNASLQTLNLCYNRLGDEAGMALADVLRSSASQQ